MKSEVAIQMLTPLWTGGVAGDSDRIRETGIIGSMRWWYEAIVRGLGGVVCDPTSGNHCVLPGKEKNDEERRGELCPVCWLFGSGGWKRRFRLEVSQTDAIPLSFCSGIPSNRKWLSEMFGGENKNIEQVKVPFGNFTLRIVSLGRASERILKKLMLVLKVMEQYGGLGAKLQHGFGMFRVSKWPDNIDPSSIFDIIPDLKREIDLWPKKPTKPSLNPQWDLRKFVNLSFDLPKKSLEIFLESKSDVEKLDQQNERRYIPCALDLRYKGSASFGMREWLRKEKGWQETIKPKEWKDLDKLLGPRSQWRIGGRTIQIHEDWRRAGSLFFSMPYNSSSDVSKYILRIYGFVPPDLREVNGHIFDLDALRDLILEYIRCVFGNEMQPTESHFGAEILSLGAGETGGGE